MSLDEQKEAIIKYGNYRYNQGYSDGLVNGVIIGSLLSIISVLTVTLIKEIKSIK